MDSDDILDTQALRHCHDLCEKRELDFIFFDAKPLTESADSQNIPNYDRKGKIDESIHSGMEMLDYELSNRLFLTSVCLCMVNRLFLKKCFTGFYPGIIHEDHSFAMMIYLNAQRVCYVPKAFFGRRIRPHSIMTNRFGMRNIEGYTTVCNPRKNPNTNTPARTSRMENGPPQIPVLHPERCNLGGTPDVAA